MLISNNSDKSSSSLLFPEKTNSIFKAKVKVTASENWKMMVIDDEEALHALTRLVFKGFTFNGRGLEIISAYSEKDAKCLFDKHPDTDVLLLDVVMETDDAGLRFVHYVRNELKNQFVRIILRTGQPGQALENKIISKYDINDYKEKSDLTDQKLITAVTCALRSYNDLKIIEQLGNELNKQNQQLQQEIEERKRSEDKMRQLSSALEQTADLVMITDKNGVIEYVNQGFEKVTGYRKVEVLGKKANLLKSEKQAKSFYKTLWETILRGEVVNEIFINRKKDGGDYYEEKTITPLKDSKGNITHFIATGKDISERMVVNYENNKNTQTFERVMALKNHLKNALEKKEFFLHYQPQLDLKSGQIISVEALLGWQNVLCSANIIQILEEIGLIIPVGEWILRTACQQGKKWLNSSLQLEHIAVNFSLVQFKQPDLLQRIDKILKETEFKPEHLMLEITEGVAKNVTEFSKILQDLHKMGIKFSIKDFGTGYSSMNSLKLLPIDMIKIDKNIVSHLTNNSNDALICSGIITLAHTLNWKVVAEDVETPEQLEILKAHNCDGIQGELCSPPLSVEKIGYFLDSRKGQP